jgi:hypothetical protein
MKDEYKAVGSWGTLGLEIVLSVMLGFFGGRWLDGKLGTDPYLGVIGFFFGCAAAVKSILRTTHEMKAITEREEKEKGNHAPLWEVPSDRDSGRDEAQAPAEPDEAARTEGSRSEPSSTTAREDDEHPS